MSKTMDKISRLFEDCKNIAPDEIVFNSKSNKNKSDCKGENSLIIGDIMEKILHDIDKEYSKSDKNSPSNDFDKDSGYEFTVSKKSKKPKERTNLSLDSYIDKKIKKEDIASKGNPDVQTQNKKYEKKLTLAVVKQDLLKQIHMISHDEGVYYYNGRTYVAIKNESDMLKLIISVASSNLYDLSDTKISQSVLKFLKADQSLIPKNYEERLYKSKHLVVMKNTVLDVKTLEFKDFNKKYLVFFELNANWTTEKPHTFLKFLKESCDDDKQIIRRVVEILGCIFSGNNDCKAFFVIETAPNSGKSTLIEFVKKVIRRDYTSSIEPQKLNGRFALGNNRGVILNTSMDIPKGKLNSEVISVLKSITGKDDITIEQKYLPSESYVSCTRFLFGTNFPIKVSEIDDDDAFWDRMYIIPFEHSISDDKKDPYLLDKLVEEKDAIVSMCLRAFSKVINNNCRFSDCDAADDMKRKWRKGDESFYSFNLFWNNFVDVTGDKEDYVYSTNLYESYEEYCYSNDFDAISIKEMHKWIENNVNPSKCYPKRTRKDSTNPRMCFIGIRLVED